MNEEQFFPKFPGQDKMEEAQAINKKIDEKINKRLKKEFKKEINEGEGLEETENKKQEKKKRGPRDELAYQIIKDKEYKPIGPEKLSSDAERLWHRNMNSAGIRVLEDGYLEIPRWDKKGKDIEKPLLIKQTVESLNTALRMQFHILDNYRLDKKEKASEFSQLENIQEVIEQANALLLEWSLAEEEEKKELQQRLASIVLRLEKCRNDLKINVKEQSEKVMLLKDSLDRENPGALAARTVGALESIRKRFNQMQLIMPIIAMRKELLILEKRRIEGIKNKAAGLLRRVSRHPVFNEKTKKPPELGIKDHEVKKLYEVIEQTLDLLDTILVSPYLEQARQTKEAIKEIEDLFSSKDNLVDHLTEVKIGLAKAIKVIESDVENLG
jgi:ElaB/YqjD/DUF883 family membrane-anchored ribosome-binding protein